MLRPARTSTGLGLGIVLGQRLGLYYILFRNGDVFSNESHMIASKPDINENKTFNSLSSFRTRLVVDTFPIWVPF